MKTRTRKESDFEMHQLMGREEIIERPELSQDALNSGEGSKLSFYEVWRQHAAFNQHSISPRAGTDTGFREALFRKRARQPVEFER